MFTHLHVHSHFSLLDGLPSPAALVERAKGLGFKALALTDHANLYGAIEFYVSAKKAGLKPILGAEIYFQRDDPADQKGTAYLRRGIVARRPGVIQRFSPESVRTAGSTRRACEAGPHPQDQIREGENQPCSPFHLTLLAMNGEGYRNLLHLISRANGYDGGGGRTEKEDPESLPRRRAWPLVWATDLLTYGDGLIILSGCRQGEIAWSFLQGDEEKARQSALWFRERFGERFFLEVQDHGLANEKRINRFLLELSRKEKIPLVATNDVHYLSPEEAAAHRLLEAVQRLQRTRPPVTTVTYPGREFYLKSPEEMERLFREIPAAIQNSQIIAERCQVELELGRLNLPRFSDGDEEGERQHLRRLAWSGAEKRYGKNSPSAGSEALPPAVTSRLDFELEVIEKRGLAGYFLIVWDIVRWARHQGIPVGPGRGSAAGSLVAYCLGLTDVDPLRFDLYFERFLNPERPDLPDIDIDFCQRRRPEVLAYVRRRYGADRVAHIAVINTLGARGAIRAAGKALGVAAGLVDRLAKLFPHLGGAGAIDEALSTIPELRRLPVDREPVKTLLAAARVLEGRPVHVSRHAAGILISPGPLPDSVPLEVGLEGEVFSQYPMEALEALGLLKIDLLGLRNLTIIEDTLAFVAATDSSPDERRTLAVPQPGLTGVHGLPGVHGQIGLPALAGIPLDDPETFRLLQAGETIGCFQLESAGMRELLRKLRPENLEDIIAVLSLYRPGPWDSGTVDAFLRRRKGKEPVTFLHPLLAPILSSSYGLLLYQEQVMKIAEAVAGFSLGQGDLLRRALAKRDREAKETFQAMFLEGAVRRGVSRRVAREIFAALERFSGYSFNRSHSAAYAHLSYVTAYLKVHYPAQYFAALLSTGMGYYDQGVYIEEARRWGVAFSLPDINHSGVSFLPERGAEGKTTIRIGFSSIKGVGPAAINAILAARTAGPFRSLGDFLRRVDLRVVNKTVLRNLIKAGALDGFGPRRGLLLILEEALATTRGQKEGVGSGLWSETGLWPETGLWSGSGQGFEPTTGLEAKGEFSQVGGGEGGRRFGDLEDFSAQEKESMQREVLTLSPGAHPLAERRKQLEENGVVCNAEIMNLPPGSLVRIAGRVANARRQITRKGETMLFLLLEDETGLAEVTLFPRVYAREALNIVPDGFIVVGRRTGWGREAKVIAEKILPLPGSPPL